ncbi:hypothetical protein HC928_09720 [bacterium]|nr:hypothetical protein [bacterium]
MLLIGGNKVLRVWMDVHSSCYVDVCASLAGTLSGQQAQSLDIETIPDGNQKKCKPFTRRIKVTQQWQAAKIIKQVRQLYGLDSKRFRVF